MTIKKDIGLTLFLRFDTIQERKSWIEKHKITQETVPYGGPIYSWSLEDEGMYRDDFQNLNDIRLGIGGTQKIDKKTGHIIFSD